MKRSHIAKVVSHHLPTADCASIVSNFYPFPVFRKKSFETFFSIQSKSIPCKRYSFQISMSGVVATPLREKRGRSKAPAFSDFFGAKVKTLLLRTRSVLQKVQPDVGGAAAALLADLDQFADAGSFEEVLNKLGGEGTLAAQMFVSVTDESERRQLELYARQRRGQQEDMMLKEIQFLVQRAQDLAKQLPASEALVGQVLALSVDAVQEEEEEDDDAGTGEQQEESRTEEKKKREKQKKQKPAETKRGRSATKKPPPPKAAEKKKAKEKDQPEKQNAKKKAKEVVAVAPEEVAPMEEEEIGLGIREQDLLRQLAEAEQELFDIQKIAQGQHVGVPLIVPPEAAPNVEQLIRTATLENVLCLSDEMDVVALNTAEAHMSLHVWWRIAKRACQIHGVFQLLRSQKSKLATLEERYVGLVSKTKSLHFEHARKYDRLGKFLSQFPLFVYQRKWTTLVDWFQKANDKGDALMDALPSMAPVSSVFFRDCFTLPVHGFQVIPGLMADCIDDNLISTCKTRCEADGEVIFNNTKDPKSRRNDKKRVQLSTDRIDGTARFKAILVQRLKLHFPRHKVDALVALLSKLGCLAQLAHTDYTPKTLANASDDKLPLACLVALMDGTVLDVWPGAIRFDKSRSYKPMQLKLNKGDVLIFRGDLVHAGAACGDVANVRIHAYLDVEGIERPKHGDGVEETHFMCDERTILSRQ